MMLPRGLLGFPNPHVQPLTPVSEVSEPPESPYDGGDPTPDDEDEFPEEDETGPPPAAVPFFKLFTYATPFDCFLMIIASIAAAAHGAALPLYLYLFGEVIGMFGQQDLNASEQSKELAKHSLSIVYVAVGALFAGWIEISFWIHTGERQTSRIRTHYMHALFKQDMGYFDTYISNGDLIIQAMNDIFLMQFTLSEKVGNYIHNMTTFLGGLIVGFISCWQVSLVTIGTGTFIVIAGGISNVFLYKFAEGIQDAYEEAATIAEQAIAYIQTLYAFANETLAKYSYANALQATLRYGVLISLVQGLGLGFTYGLGICSCALQLWFGHFLVSKNLVDGRDVVVALFSIILSGLGLNQAATNFYAFEQGRIAAYRILSLIESSPRTNSSDGKSLVNIQGNLEFRNVYFSYPVNPDVPVLNGFFLNIPARKTVAVVGRQDCGKSSIIPLIERFYDPSLGEVMLDGENIKNLNIKWLRSQIGLITQSPALFSTSIKENILYGRSASMFEIEEAAKIANVHAFISSLPEAYDTKVGAVAELSMEQKLKLAIARAVLKNPCILLLDDITGVLDAEDERIIQDVLSFLMLGRTTIMTAHHLSVVRTADLIAVLDEGQLVELGTHEDLIQVNGLYLDLISHEEAAMPPKWVAVKKPNYKADIPPLELSDSPSLQHQHEDCADYFNSQASAHSPSTELKEIKNITSFEIHESNSSINDHQQNLEACLPSLTKLNVKALQRLSSKTSHQESPISLLLTSDPKNERSHSQVFSRTDIGPKINCKESTEGSKSKAPSFWRLAKLSLPEWFYAIIGSSGAAVFGSFNPLLAFFTVQIVQNYYEAQETENEVNKWCLFLVAMSVVTVVANFLQHFYFGIMGEKMTERVRRIMFSAILRNEVAWFDEEENSTDTLSMYLSIDATFVRAAFSNCLSLFVQDSAAVIVAFVFGFVLQSQVALIALASLPFLIISAVSQKIWVAGFAGDIQEVHKKSSLVLENAVRNIFTVVAFSAEQKVMQVYDGYLSRILMRISLRSQIKGIAFGVSRFLLFACNAFLLWYAASVVKRSDAQLSTVLKQFVIFSFAMFALVEPFGLAPHILKQRKSLVSVFAIMDRKPKMDTDEASGLCLRNVYGTIELRNVDFSYSTQPNRMILENLNLKVTGGQTVAIVGASGSGKSTVIALIERFYDPLSGQVLLDGKDIKILNLKWFRNHMGLVQQEPVLFSTSIRDNIIYSRHNATEAEMTEAARIANAHHFISSLPHGYDTQVGMRGLELTSGQKQRIAIARVVLKNAPILLLDESRSALESESSRAVQEALETLIMGNKTTILIAHRFTMMRHVDMIVVLNEGHIVEEGSHDALIAKNGLYARLMQPHFKSTLHHQHRRP